MAPDILKRAEAIEDAVVRWRRHFHAHPEISFNEFETSSTIADILTKMGCENVRVGTIGRPTGVIADINGAHAGRRVALRADIDALPVTEQTGLEFASVNQGVMHACGHDAHIAMLLGAAQILCGVKDELKGSVRLIFQPSEESADVAQGAKSMIADGFALNGVDAIFGVHIWVPLEDGVLGWTNGPIMASSDRWHLKIQGKGGHGASPHQTYDPTLVVSAFLSAIQTFVSRESDPMATAVVSTGIIRAGTAFNIIPDTAELIGTARTFDPTVSTALEAAMARYSNNICAAYRCKPDFEFQRMLAPTVNDPEMARLGAAAARKVFDPAFVRETTPVMAAEDFGCYLEKIPGSFFFVGSGSKQCSYPHHHPKFTINENLLIKGAAFEAQTAFDFLS